MKGGCAAGLPVLCVVSPLLLRGGPVEGREWCVLCCPRVRIGSGTLHCLPPSALSVPPRIVLVPLLFCVAVFVVGGEVRWWDCALFCSVLLCSSVFVFVVTALLV